MIFDSVNFDFNEDKVEDKILVLKDTTTKFLDDIRYFQSLLRPFIILQGITDSTFHLIVRNDKLIWDKDSGGMLGDPYQSIKADSKKIKIHYFGGSGIRWNQLFEYTFNQRNKMWFLSREESTSYSICDIDSTYIEEIKDYSISDSIFINEQIEEDY